MLHMDDVFTSLYYIPWFGWIAIVGIIAGVIITVAKTFAGRNTKLVEALEQNSVINEKLITRLDAIDSRLGEVEKTLTDIP